MINNKDYIDYIVIIGDSCLAGEILEVNNARSQSIGAGLPF